MGGRAALCRVTTVVPGGHVSRPTGRPPRRCGLRLLLEDWEDHFVELDKCTEWRSLLFNNTQQLESQSFSKTFRRDAPRHVFPLPW